MADEPQKPRKVKDLKARLGRTIAPNTGQAGAGAAVAPPSVGAAAPAAVPRPPMGAGAGVVAPPGPGGVVPPAIGGASVPAPPGIAAPPFARPAAAKPQSSDVFAAVSIAPASHEVRLVIDEKPVDDAEVGRKRRGRVLLLVGVGAVIGLALGAMAGSMRSDRELYNLAVADGKDIYETVRTSSDVVTKSQRFVDAAVAAARGGPGKQPSVDYQAIEALRALEKPLQAGAFARKRYRAFQPQTVDALFEYYNSVNLLWEEFARLGNRTLPAARRQVLNAAVEAAGAVATPTGCVPSVTEERWSCGLVFVAPNEAGDGTTVMVRTRRATPQQFEKTVFSGDTEALVADPGDFVVIIDPERSVGVLGEQASDFAEYTRQLSEIKALLDRTVEVQGRLERDLSDVARLEQIFNI